MSEETITYAFEIDEEVWREWANTIPREEPLDARIRELIKTDLETRA